MAKKKSGFGTNIGFELAAVGSAVGLGNLWGFPYKTSANGGAAYLFVYLACILLIGAVAMLSEFILGRRARANPVSAFKAVSPGWGWAGLLAVLIPALIMCYYFLLGGFTVKYALNSFVGNAGNFQRFAANTGDVLLHTVIFALLALAVIRSGVRAGIERWAKILLPTMLVILVVILCHALLLGEGVADGLAFYLRPNFAALSGAGVLSAMGQAFFSLSLGCGAMIAYGSYTGRRVDLLRSTAVICLVDSLLTFLVGLAVFPALFHYAAVSGAAAEELGMGGIGLLFITLPLVFEDMPFLGRTLSLLFFAMTAIAALTSVISILEVVTQFVLQRYKVFRGRAAALITGVCVLLSIPVGVSLGASLNGGAALNIFGRNLLELLDMLTNTLLMPFCALLACLAVGWKLDTAAELSRLRPGGLGQSGLLRAMLRYGTPLLIVVIELFGAADIVYPMTGGARRFSADGLGVVTLAAGLVLLCVLLYFARLRRRDTGDNRVEALLDEQEAARRLAGPERGWYREEAQVDHEE
ncbi:MAG: sodium-dependent transporter [Oscillospiraceae bacterium]|nr:sodium-dependent transporter [Oscillospiraceae bacterium]